MTTAPETTIVDPSHAPLGCRPELLGVEYLSLTYAFHPQRYRCEAWHLTNGAAVVIVTDNGGTSLMNASEKIAKTVRKRWKIADLTIIEDWIEPFIDSDPETRFRISSENGGNRRLDYDEWAALGIVLPR